MTSKWLLPLLLLLLTPCFAFCDTIVLDFEGLSDGDLLTTQFPGLSFTNAAVLSAGISLNEFEFPPRSGTNVIFDSGGSLLINFAAPILSFAGFFTHLTSVTISAFDASNNLVDTASSLFGSNLALSGDAGSSPNELLDVLSAGGISSVLISGSSEGGSFVLDDASIDTGVVVSVSAPGTLGLLAIGLSAMLSAVRSRRKMQL